MGSEHDKSMRQGQQNRRGRGRNNRKGQNPLARSFESNGPDVKIRGTATHVAEKYMSLARDALSSGDPVLAENYLQHAEHYNRIIMAYREQQMQQGGDPGGMGQRPRGPGFADPMGGDDDMGPDDGDDFGQGEQPAAMPARLRPDQPHGGYDQQPQGQGFERPERTHRPDRHERHERHHRHDRNERHDRHDRPRHDDQRSRPPGDDGYPQQHQHPSRYRERRPYPGSEPQPVSEAVAGTGEAGHPPVQPAAQEPRPGRMPRRERFSQGGGSQGGGPDRGHEQPDFLRRPVRRVRRDTNGNGSEDTGESSQDAGPGAEGGGPQIDKSRL